MEKKTYIHPKTQLTATLSFDLLTPTIKDTTGADGLGTGDDEGTGEAGIDFGNAKDREGDSPFEWGDSLW